MLLFDGHLDLAMNAIDWNRDLRQAVDDLRAQERSLGMTEAGRGASTLSLPELRQAKVGVCVSTLIARQEKEINHPFGCTTPEACYAMAHAHLAYHRAMEQGGWMRLIHCRADLEHHVMAYEKAPESEPLGCILTMEGADPLLGPSALEEFYSQGLRAIGLTHYGANRYGGGTRSEVGLALASVELIREIERLHMALDLTHLSDVAFWQAEKMFSGRVHASHQNARRICDWQRQFSDDQYKVIIERDGVIGVAFDIIMLQPGYVRGQSMREATIARAVDNIDLICQMAGNARHAAIGTDLDGGYGCEQTPSDLDRMTDLQNKLPEMLRQRGYNDADVRLIMHGNWIRYYSEVLQ